MIDGITLTPATGKLFNVDKDAERINKKMSEVFQSLIAKLLYIMKRARPDIQTSVSFLMKRVSKSDMDDWKKLKRVLSFLKRTEDGLQNTETSSLTEIMTWIDTSHAVHENMRTHLSCIMSMGISALHAKSSAEKISTKSTCKSEIVAVLEYLPNNIWMIMSHRA